MRVFTPKLSIALGQYIKPSDARFINPIKVKKDVEQKQVTIRVDVQSFLPGQIYKNGFLNTDIAVINMFHLYGKKLKSLEEFASRELQEVGDRKQIVLYKIPPIKNGEELSPTWSEEFLLEHFYEGAETGFVTIASTSEQIIDEIDKALTGRLSVICTRN